MNPTTLTRIALALTLAPAAAAMPFGIGTGPGDAGGSDAVPPQVEPASDPLDQNSGLVANEPGALELGELTFRQWMERWETVLRPRLADESLHAVLRLKRSAPELGEAAVDGFFSGAELIEHASADPEVGKDASRKLQQVRDTFTPQKRRRLGLPVSKGAQNRDLEHLAHNLSKGIRTILTVAEVFSTAETQGVRLPETVRADLVRYTRFYHRAEQAYRPRYEAYAADVIGPSTLEEYVLQFYASFLSEGVDAGPSDVLLDDSRDAQAATE